MRMPKSGDTLGRRFFSGEDLLGGAFVDILLILSVSLIVISWFKGQFLVNPGDMNFSFSPVNDLYRSLFVWDHQQGFGAMDSLATAKIFPYNLLLAALSASGFSIYSCEKILFYLLFALSGVSAYFLIRWLLDGERWTRAPALIGANYYMFNMYLVQLRWGSGYIMGMFFYSVFPALVLNWMKARNLLGLRYSVYMALLLLLALPSMNNPAYLGPILVVCSLDLLFQFVSQCSDLDKILKLAKFLVQTAVVFAGIFCFWLVSIAITFGNNVSGLVKSTAQFKQEVVSSSASSIFNMFRGLGHWGFFSGYRGDLYYSYSAIYSIPAFVAIAFLLVIVAFIVLFRLPRDRERRSQVLFFASVFIVGLWLSKCVHAPLGGIYQWALENIPLFLSFRAAYEKFGPLLCLSSAVLMSYSVSFLAEKISKTRFSAALFVLVAGLVNIYAWPFWTGDIWQEQGRALPGMRFAIPSSYAQLGKYLSAHYAPGKRILVLPPIDGLLPGIVPLNLDGWRYVGADPLGRLLKNPLVYLSDAGYSRADRLMSTLTGVYHEDPNRFFALIPALAGILGIDAVLLRGDMDDTTYPWIEKANKIRPFLSNFKVDGEFGEMTLYKLSAAAPLFYPAMKVVLFNGAPSLIVNFPPKMFKEEPVFVSVEENSGGVGNIKGISTSSRTGFDGKTDLHPPELSFHKVNPAEYVVNVASATSPFALVFSEQYHGGWTAYRLKTERGPMSLLETIFGLAGGEKLKCHFVANAYSNGWIVDPGGEASFRIVVEFSPQRYFVAGVIVSVFSVLLCLVALIWERKGRSEKPDAAEGGKL